MTEEEAKSMGDLFPDLGPEAPVISGIAHDRSEALATVRAFGAAYEVDETDVERMNRAMASALEKQYGA